MPIRGKTTIEVWKQALMFILENGEHFLDSNGRGAIEATNLQVTIETPEADIEEPIKLLRRSDEWVYPAQEEIADIVTHKRLSPAYAYSYGPRIFNFNGAVDQIENYVIPLLKYDTKSRRAMVMIWNPIEDCRMHNKLVPGIICIHFLLRRNKLNVTSIVRSNDFFFGWPANTFQVFTLMKHVAESIGTATGSITTFSMSAHIFSDEVAHINKLLRS